MNNIKNIFVYILLLLSLNNCSDHVDYEAIENYAITAEVYFQQESDYDAALVGTYDPLQWIFFNIQIGQIYLYVVEKVLQITWVFRKLIA